MSNDRVNRSQHGREADVVVGRTIVYVGTDAPGVESSHGEGSSNRVYVCELDEVTGQLTLLQQVASPSPWYLVVSEARRVVYAACRGSKHEQDAFGLVVSYSIDVSTGMLTLVDQVRIPAHPAYISLDRTESCALVACYFAGSVAVVPLRDSGALDKSSSIVEHVDGPSIMSQGITSDMIGKQPWPSGSVMPHSILADSTNRFALVCDVGLNRIAVYCFDVESGLLSPKLTGVGRGCTDRGRSADAKSCSLAVSSGSRAATHVLQRDGRSSVRRE